MSQDVSSWLSKLEQAFAGSSGMVGQRLAELMKHEQDLSERHVTRFKGYVVVMDAFFDFCLQTFQLAARRDKTQWTDNLPLLTAIHISTMWRFRSSYILFWKGYYVDAQGLLRAVFENAIQLSAFQKGIIGITEVTGLDLGAPTGQDQPTSNELYRRMNDRARETDSKVRQAILGEGSGLDVAVQDDIGVVLKILHLAVHKSKLALVQHYTSWLRGERPLPIYPDYDENWASAYMNVSEFFAWMIVRLLPCLQTRPGEFGEEWTRKYRVLDETLAVAHEGLQELGKSLGGSIKTFMEAKFTFLQGA